MCPVHPLQNNIFIRMTTCLKCWRFRTNTSQCHLKINCKIGMSGILKRWCFVCFRRANTSWLRWGGQPVIVQTPSVSRWFHFHVVVKADCPTLYLWYAFSKISHCVPPCEMYRSRYSHSYCALSALRKSESAVFSRSSFELVSNEKEELYWNTHSPICLFVRETRKPGSYFCWHRQRRFPFSLSGSILLRNSTL